MKDAAYLGIIAVILAGGLWGIYEYKKALTETPFVSNIETSTVNSVEVATTKTFYTQSVANVRKCASLSCDPIGTFDINTEITGPSDLPEWLELNWKDSNGVEIKGFINKVNLGTSEVVIKEKTNQQICEEDFGLNSLYSGKKNNTGGPICDCKNGYDWNAGGTSCSVTINTDTLGCSSDHGFNTRTGAPCFDAQQSCEKSFGLNSLYSGKKSNDGRIICGCKDGYEWNKGETACVIVQVKTGDQICSEGYPHAEWDGTKSNGKYNCVCEKGYYWNDDGDCEREQQDLIQATQDIYEEIADQQAVLDEIEALQQQISDITEQYHKDVAAIENTGADLAFKNGKISKLTSSVNAQIQQLNQEIQQLKAILER